jgi:hypothetical protein
VSDKTEKWIGFRQAGDGGTVAMFAMPSGRIREVPLDRDLMLKALTELARAIRFGEQVGSRE